VQKGEVAIHLAEDQVVVKKEERRRNSRARECIPNNENYCSIREC
jgi:hypothetical protein